MQGSDRVVKVEKDKKGFDDELYYTTEFKDRKRRRTIKLNRVSGLYYYHKRFSRRNDEL